MNSDVRSIGDAVKEYLDWGGCQGWKSSTRVMTQTALTRFFRGMEELPLSALTPRRCEAAYAELIECMRPASHRDRLAHAQRLLKWCEKRGYIKSNPAAAVEPVGRIARGKPQLSVDEARRWIATAQEIALGLLRTEETESARQAALVLLMLLMMGLRRSEALNREVRDLDNGGATLWIRHAKTEAGNRRPPVPELLQPLLRERSADRPRDALLFYNEETRKRWGVAWLGRWMNRICDLANVPRVCPHSLRGLYTTLSARSGVDPEVIAKAVGHSSAAITKQHYILPGSEALTQQARVVEELTGGRAVRPELLN